jgi:hypothetical protein
MSPMQPMELLRIALQPVELKGMEGDAPASVPIAASATRCGKKEKDADLDKRALGSIAACTAATLSLADREE